MTLTSGRLTLLGRVPETTDALRMTDFAILNLKGGTILDAGFNHISCYNSFIFATRSGMDNTARVLGGAGGGNLYVEHTVINIGGGTFASNGQMVLLVEEEVHMTSSYLGVTLDFASNSADKLKCWKLILQPESGGNTVTVGYKNLPNPWITASG